MPGFTQKFSPTIRWRLRALVFACILPYCLLALTFISRDYALANNSFVENALNTGRSSAADIDSEFRVLEASLLAFSTSPDFAMRTLAALDHQARALVQMQKTFHILVEDASGKPLINTSVPHGAALEGSNVTHMIAPSFTSSRAAVSSLFLDPASQQRMVAIRTPLTTRDGERVVLSAMLPVRHFAEQLRQRHFPTHWIVSILDRDGGIIARSSDNEKFVGMKVGARVFEQMQLHPLTAFKANSLDGTSMLVVAARTPKSGWTVAIGVPANELQLDTQYKLAYLIVLTATLLAIGLIIACRISTQIRHAMNKLIQSAIELGMGQLIARQPYGFREAEQVGNAIAQASVMLIEAQHQARHDTLTGLANRSMFYAFLQQQITVSERQGGELAVIYIDLDNFKPINDRFGHAAGDALLIEAASRLASLLRRSDLAGRMGGDEFAVALSGNAAGIAVVKEKLQTVMEAPYYIDGVPVRADASLGAARYPGDGKTVAELLEKADDAMYEEKARRKSRQPG